VLVLRDLAFALEATDLFIEGVNQLLTGRRSREVCALVERATEESQVTLTFERAVERHAHAVEEVDDLRRPVRHFVHRWLVREEVATVDRFIKVLVFRVTLLARDLVAGVDAALSADRVRALHGNDGEEIDADAGLCNAHGCGETCKASTDNDHATLGVYCHVGNPNSDRGFWRFIRASWIRGRGNESTRRMLWKETELYERSSVKLVLRALAAKGKSRSALTDALVSGTWIEDDTTWCSRASV